MNGSSTKVMRIVASVIVSSFTLPNNFRYSVPCLSCERATDHLSISLKRYIVNLKRNESFAKFFRRPPGLIQSFMSLSFIRPACFLVSRVRNSVQCGKAMSMITPSGYDDVAELTKDYVTIRERVSAETEVKRSKFLVEAIPITTEGEAMAFLEEVSDPSASHNCWAYRIGDRCRFSDDGEPGGTAGRPILSAIDGAGLAGVMVVITRYFGGTKLGTGGLVRAYGGAAQICLKDASTVVIKAKVLVSVEVPYEHLGAVYSSLMVFGDAVEKVEECFSESSENPGVLLKLLVETKALPALTAGLKNSTRGCVTLRQ